ncbi:MAG TPA: DUF2007 domain-containing protein [Kiritimatiellia bacterium]|nr:DUF2007 domain-containing protein [Kiritimatiellia bacterium]HMO98233.1 DUF2007 domain-containing protein [Kiritimatiellia bacterium]HMP97190.1 DUF2007 domain-containing protein [Kiritimatiellia bacterium]
MKTIARVSWIHQADMIRMRLDGAGIDAWIPDENTVAVNPWYGGLIGGIRVQVCDEDEEEALRILALDPEVSD